MKAFWIALLSGLLVIAAPAEELKQAQVIPSDPNSSAKILEASDKAFTVEFTNRNSYDVVVEPTVAGIQRKSANEWEVLDRYSFCGTRDANSDPPRGLIKAGETKRLKLFAKSHEPWFAGDVIRIGIICYLPASMTVADKAGGVRGVNSEEYQTTKGPK